MDMISLVQSKGQGQMLILRSDCFSLQMVFTWLIRRQAGAGCCRSLPITTRVGFSCYCVSSQLWQHYLSVSEFTKFCLIYHEGE